jgi:hypothetical protein
MGWVETNRFIALRRSVVVVVIGGGKDGVGGFPDGRAAWVSGQGVGTSILL